MPPAVTFRSEDGAVLIDGCPLEIVAGLSKQSVQLALSPDFRSHLDHKNGYEWLYFDGFLLGGEICSLSFCFFRERLQQVHWGVALPNEEVRGGWPTQQAIDNELAFLRRVLTDAFGRRFERGEERFPWGVVWASIDPKGFQASSGLRYQE